MSLVRTSFIRGRTLSGITLLPGEGRGPGRCDEQRFPLPWTPASAGEQLGGPSPEQPVDEPAGQPAAAVPDQTLAIDPVPPPAGILDAVIVAQPRRRGRTPPFGCDPLGSLDA